MLQFRNPIDIGSVYWSANLIISQASVIVCTILYNAYFEGGAEADLGSTANNATSTNSTADSATKFTEEQLKASVGSLFAVFIISFTLFMVKIERKYVKTFFATETAHAKVKRNFVEGKDDFAKSQIFRRQKRQWMSIRPQVGEWLDQNWDIWEREQPDWFNEVFIESVDDDIMPARVLARLKEEAEGGLRRRSSFMERVSGRHVTDTEEEEKGSDSDSSVGEEED